MDRGVAPYVDAFKLAERYDWLVVEDLRRAAFDTFGPVDSDGWSR